MILMIWKPKRPRIISSRLPWTRFIGPSLTIMGLLALLAFGVSKGVDFASLDRDSTSVVTGLSPSDLDPGDLDARDLDGGGLVVGSTAPSGPAMTAGRLVVGTRKAADRIRIASFNIEVFGEKKSQDPNVMGVLTNIMMHFDLIAIQEVRSPQAQPVARLVQQINAAGGRYDSMVSPSLGRTHQTEQYAFVWDSTRIRAVPHTSYIVSDPEPDDRMHREPMASTFQVIVPADSGRDGFRFTIINVHTDPDEVIGAGPDNELNVLDDVYLSIREYEYMRQAEDDIILVGDLNVDREHLFELGAIRGLASVAGDTPTNTAGTKVYDHILVDRSTTTEFTGAAGVIDYVSDWKLTAQQAALVSDHRPVWAEFSRFEQPAFSAVAARPDTVPR